MADPSHPFVSVLMTLVLKRDSLHIPNTFSLSLPSLCLYLKHCHQSTPINHSIMTPGKSQSSSHRKEKEIACDDLAMRDVGEEATHYELDRFDEEA